MKSAIGPHQKTRQKMEEDDDNTTVASGKVVGIGVVKSPVRRSQASQSPARNSSRPSARPSSKKSEVAEPTTYEVELKTSSNGTPATLNRTNSKGKVANSVPEDSTKTAFGRKVPEESPVRRKSKQNMAKEIEESRKSMEMDSSESKQEEEEEETKASEQQLIDHKHTKEESETENDPFELVHQMSFSDLFKDVCNRMKEDVQSMCLKSFHGIIAKDIEHPAERRNQIIANVRIVHI
jgi:hypothetical protein